MTDVLFFAFGIVVMKFGIEPLAKFAGQLIWLGYQDAAFDTLDRLLPDNLDRSLEQWQESLTEIFMADFALTERMATMLAGKTLSEAKLAPFIRKRAG